MSKYHYIAKNTSDAVTKGEVEAENKKAAQEAIASQSLTPVLIKEVSDSGMSSFFDRFSLVPATEKIMFTNQLATLISAGVPISQSMHILQEQTKNNSLKKAIKAIGDDVEGGVALSAAMKKQPKIFSPLFVSIVSSGEVGGTLDKSLETVASEIEKEHDLVSSIRGAMTYPIVIMVAMVGVVTYMLTNVVPQIAAIFTELGGKLPLSTEILITISKLVREQGLLVVAVIIFLIYLFRTGVKKNKRLKLIWHKSLLRTPVFGGLMSKVNITRFTRTLGSLFASGVTVVEAMEISAGTIQNEVFKSDILRAAEDVKNGSSIADALKKTHNFPIILPEMISIGEETGSLDSILGKITTFYQKELDNTIKNLSTLLEPLMMIVIGIGVGFIVISIITPIYQMTNLM